MQDCYVGDIGEYALLTAAGAALCSSRCAGAAGASMAPSSGFKALSDADLVFLDPDNGFAPDAIASTIKVRASSRVLATATQPGRSGTVAPTLDGPCSKTTAYFIFSIPASFIMHPSSSAS